ncbi:hypothetical protein M9H77_23725 [Catharanthus roseus]|uniref:Uncharacterized protein n=1 Tax=Catharanthus roseus TaxID=4058 RepID=A0ACC0AVD7_CATRO|nr:hypothetical protein M9H77_23725 [Catharanthus roseus]
MEFMHYLSTAAIALGLSVEPNNTRLDHALCATGTSTTVTIVPLSRKQKHIHTTTQGPSSHRSPGFGVNNVHSIFNKGTKWTGLKCHTDPRVITLMLQDQLGGLQATRDGDKSWITVQPIEEAFVKLAKEKELKDAEKAKLEAKPIEEIFA